MKKPVGDQIKYRHVPATTNWGQPDDRHCIHIRINDFGKPAWVTYSEHEWKELSDAMTTWCRENFRKPFDRKMSITGVWHASSDRKLFVFRRKDHAMLFKLTWSV